MKAWLDAYHGLDAGNAELSGIMLPTQVFNTLRSTIMLARLEVL
jgi:hypothetical protein